MYMFNPRVKPLFPMDYGISLHQGESTSMIDFIISI